MKSHTDFFEFRGVTWDDEFASYENVDFLQPIKVRFSQCGTKLTFAGNYDKQFVGRGLWGVFHKLFPTNKKEHMLLVTARKK